MHNLQQAFHVTKPLKTKVVIGYSIYNSTSVTYIDSFVSDCSKMVNMQWEQIKFDKARDFEGEDNIYTSYAGDALKVSFLCWGPNNFDLITKRYHIPERNICVCGFIPLDFMRPQMRRYFYSREEILKQFQLPKNKRISLFISSFTRTGLSENVLKMDVFTKQGYDNSAFSSLSIKSQNIILDWIESAVQKEPDIVFIYRPHPVEFVSERIHEMEKYDNFFVIPDYSVRQWILVADNINAWMSTSAIDIYAAGKTFGILRPIPHPEMFEESIYYNASFIDTQEAFFASLNEPLPFPIPAENIQNIYYVDPKKPSYQLFCDFLEEVLRDDSRSIEYTHHNRYEQGWYRFLRNQKRWLIRKLVNGPSLAFLGRALFKDKFDVYQYEYDNWQKNYTDDLEIDRIMQKLKNTLES